MRHLIVEIQIFKKYNEQLKKALEKQHEINEILLQSLHERNNGKDQWIETKKDWEVGESVERKYSSSSDTQKYEN